MNKVAPLILVRKLKITNILGWNRCSYPLIWSQFVLLRVTWFVLLCFVAHPTTLFFLAIWYFNTKKSLKNGEHTSLKNEQFYTILPNFAHWASDDVYSFLGWLCQPGRTWQYVCRRPSESGQAAVEEAQINGYNANGCWEMGAHDLNFAENGHWMC